MAERPVFHDWKYAFDDRFERVEKIRGLTRRQRSWIIRAWRSVFGLKNNQVICGFPVVKHEGFYLCGVTDKVEVHHIMPRGYASLVLGWDERRINHPLNLIPLCQKHHVARGLVELDYHNNVVPAVHPDMEWARINYRGKDRPTSYDGVFDWRFERMRLGEPYWNTDWDQALLMKAEEVYHRYLNWQLDKFGEYRDPWPVRK